MQTRKAPETPRGHGSSNPKLQPTLDLLEEGVKGITDSRSFKEFLRFQSRFHEYSFNNTMLILLQHRSATKVAGFKRWKELGRHVKKGERGIKILAPVFRKVEDPETGEEIRVMCGCKPVTVFALDQTAPEPGADSIPEPPKPGEPVEDPDSPDAARGLERKLRIVCEREGVDVCASRLSRGNYGYYDRLNTRIVLSRSLSEIERATTLAHELVHHFLHGVRSSQPAAEPGTGEAGAGEVETDPRVLSAAVKETEAEGAAFVVCHRYGLDTGAFSFAYVARAASDPELLKGCLSRIQKAASKVIAGIESERLPTGEGAEAAGGGPESGAA